MFVLISAEEKHCIVLESDLVVNKCFVKNCQIDFILSKIAKSYLNLNQYVFCYDILQKYVATLANLCYISLSFLKESSLWHHTEKNTEQVGFNVLKFPYLVYILYFKHTSEEMTDVQDDITKALLRCF